MKQPMTKLWPTSIPLMPAYILIEFVQNTANDPMYILYIMPRSMLYPINALKNLGTIIEVSPL